MIRKSLFIGCSAFGLLVFGAITPRHDKSIPVSYVNIDDPRINPNVVQQEPIPIMIGGPAEKIYTTFQEIENKAKDTAVSLVDLVRIINKLHPLKRDDFKNGEDRIAKLIANKIVHFLLKDDKEPSHLVWFMLNYIAPLLQIKILQPNEHYVFVVSIFFHILFDDIAPSMKLNQLILDKKAVCSKMFGTLPRHDRASGWDSGNSNFQTFFRNNRMSSFLESYLQGITLYQQDDPHKRKYIDTKNVDAYQMDPYYIAALQKNRFIIKLLRHLQVPEIRYQYAHGTSTVFEILLLQGEKEAASFLHPLPQETKEEMEEGNPVKRHFPEDEGKKSTKRRLF